MRDTLKLALRLMLFTLLSGLMLAVVNELTKGPIAAQNEDKANTALNEVFSAANQFEAYAGADLAAYPDLDAVYLAKADDQLLGYAFQMSPTGYASDIVFTLGIHIDGSISAMYVNSQQETAGLGSRVADEAFLSQFPGVAADPDAIDGRVDAITGATISSKAVLGAIKTATTFSRDVLQIEGAENEDVASSAGDATEEELAVAESIEAESAQALNPYAALGYETISEVYRVKFEGENGYAIRLTAQSNGIIRMTMVILEDGTVKSLTVEEQHEGEGYGAKIQEAPFTDQFDGISTSLPLNEQVDGITGATGTTTVVMGSLNEAIDYFNNYLAGGGDAE